MFYNVLSNNELYPGFRGLLLTQKILKMKILTGIAAALVLSAAASALKTLTADNFEHDTQAATGQTTGVWWVKIARVQSCLACLMWTSSIRRNYFFQITSRITFNGHPFSLQAHQILHLFKRPMSIYAR